MKEKKTDANSKMRLSYFQSDEVHRSDPRYRSRSTREAMERKARDRYKSTDEIYSILESVCNGPIVKEIFPGFEDYSVITERLESAIYGWVPEYTKKILREMSNALPSDDDKLATINLDDPTNMPKVIPVIKSYFEQMGQEDPRLLEYQFNDVIGDVIKNSDVLEVANKHNKGAPGAGRDRDYYGSFIIAAYLYSRQSDEAADAGLDHEASTALHNASLFCALAVEHNELKYDVEVRSKLARAGGDAKAKKFQPLKDEVVHLLGTMRPASGWRTHANVIRTFCDTRPYENGDKTGKLTPGPITLFQESANLPAKLGSENMEKTLRNWLKRDEAIKAAFERNKGCSK